MLRCLWPRTRSDYIRVIRWALIAAIWAILAGYPQASLPIVVSTEPAAYPEMSRPSASPVALATISDVSPVSGYSLSPPRPGDETPTPTTTLTKTASPTRIVTTTATFSSSPSPTFTVTPTPLPRIVASYPLDGDQAVPPDARFTVILSGDVDPRRVEATFTFSPTTEGDLVWEGSTRASFYPMSLITNTLYTMIFTLRVPDAGVDSGHVFTASFRTGERGTPIPILMYHRLAELDPDASPSQRDWTVLPAHFEEQLAYLAEHGYHSIDFEQLAAYLQDHEPLPPRPVVISMDDGYRDVYDVAWPLLKRYGFSACLFVLPGHVGFPAYLDWEQMEVLREAGFYFGSHSLTHPNLRKADPEEARRQICDSKALIEEKLQQTVTAFCYPLGAYDESIIGLLKECGYRMACTLANGYYQRAKDDGLFHLKRIWISYGTTLEQFADKLPW